MATVGAGGGEWRGAHVLSVEDAACRSREALEELFETAARLQAGAKGDDSDRTSSCMQGRVLATLFFEPSTRTQNSFQAAFQRLGGSVLVFNAAVSSAKKGETLEDTVRTMACYADAVVMRHPQRGAVQRAAEACDALAGSLGDSTAVPVLNAGDGIGEHPTQALLDMYTMRCELPELFTGAEREDAVVVVTMVGDLAHGRTTHSLAKLLATYCPTATLNYVAPEALRMPTEIQEYVEATTEGRATQQEHEQLTPDLLAATDVLYVTRIQKERFESEELFSRVKNTFSITEDTMRDAKERMALMHPLPRVNEISTEVDADPRAAYFRQMRNGMFLRMALLSLVLAPPTR